MHDHFNNLKQRGSGRGALYRTLEATTGELTSYCCALVGTFTPSTYYVGYSDKTIRRVRREHAANGMDFSSLAKCYKSSRQQIVVDDFDREAVRGHIYQLYEAKENLTLSKLLARKYFLSFWTVKKADCLCFSKCYEKIHFSLAAERHCKNC